MTDLLGDQERVTEIAERAAGTDDFDVWEQVMFPHQPVLSMRDGSIAGCQCLDRVFIKGKEDWGTHLAMVVTERLAERDSALVERLRTAEAERIECARCGSIMIRQQEDNTASNEAMEVCSRCVGEMWQADRIELGNELATVKQQCSDNLREITARDAVIAGVRAMIPEGNRELIEHGYSIDAADILSLLTAVPVSVLASHDAEVAARAWDEGATWAAVECGAIARPENQFLTPGDNPYREGE